MKIDRVIRILENNKEGYEKLFEVAGNEKTRTVFKEQVQAFEIAINKLNEEKKGSK